jgi:hypothetical protein
MLAAVGATRRAFPPAATQDRRPQQVPEPSSEETGRAFVDRAIAEIKPAVRSSTVPLVSDHQGRPILYGTGTLFEVGEERLLVTADHVVASAEGDGLRLKTTTRFGQGADAIPLCGRVYRSDEHHDIAVLHMERSTAEALSGRRFLRFSDVELVEGEPSLGLYLVFGYPTRMLVCNAEIRRACTRAITFRTELYDGRTGNLANYYPDRDILVWGNEPGRTTSYGIPTDEPASLRGISGCSIWLVHRVRDPMEQWEPDDAKIVAVETAVYGGNKIIRGTYWTAVARFIWEYIRALRGPIGLHTGWT